MIDLTEDAGLPIVVKVDKDFNLQFGDELQVETRKVRKLGEMKDVLLEKENISEETVVYKMYDGVYTTENKTLFHEKKLRYDLTLIFPGKTGREFIKTAGHYHSISDDSQFTYPELYEVLYGEVHFILQKQGDRAHRIADAVVIMAKRGQRIVVPPSYGHVAINPGKDPLVLANWIAEDCRPDYASLSKYGGASLFEIDENGERRFLLNKHYEIIRGYRTIEVSPALSSLFNLDNERSLYDLLLEDSNSLDWLRYPSREIVRFGEYIGEKIQG
jgi:glucose-6-phosphate isomerase